ncbi:LivM5 [Desulforapulum autotrophicum HRM2]|uniref:LivM5 n=1 Tax=Desulforapulum autotrophicum (strain ATCC 43914 / DSM 3382 / VKM B-1955 / HRM2) TaxID=177437 RepID=C0QIH8_DESAH|nr:branched-chain amino acid ABC transporter permease [Desulforapulum autotrophicum]ACN17922.1 LivM5 [Desulforapulum autotrophicum HRM2]
MDYLYHILILIMIYSIFAISLNLELGFAGLYNFGHIAFFAIGAYTSALLSLGGMPIPLAVVLALVASGVAGAILARFTLGLSGDYFGIATLVFAEMIQLLLLNERDITRGPMGLPGIPRPAWMGSGHEGLIWFLAVAVIGTVLVFFLVRRISNAPFGRALKVVREDEFVAQALGKNTFILKTKAMVMGSVLAGFAGVLWAHYITYISPSDFTLNETIFVLLCVVVGGKGTNVGPLVGAFVIVFFGEFVRFLPIPSEFSRFVAPLQGMVYGALLIFMMLKRPQGLISESRR